MRKSSEYLCHLHRTFTLISFHCSPIEEQIIEVDEEEIVEEVTLSHQCRLCLDMVDPDDSRNANLFDTPRNANSLSGELLEWFHVIIEQSPLWPTTACYKCVRFMHQIQGFKDQILASHRRLYKEIVLQGNGGIEETIEVQQEDLPEALQSMCANLIDNADEEPEGMDVVEDEVDHNSEAESEKVDSGEEATGADYWNYLAKKYSIQKLPPRDLKREEELQKQMLELKWLICNECSQDDFQTLQDLNRHYKTEHDQIKAYIGCCQTKFGLFKGALDHMEYHLNANKFKCIPCDKQFKSGYLLAHHNLRNHPKEEFQCKTCGKVVGTRAKLKQHEATHLPTEERPHKCGYCPKAFASPGNFKRHVERMHEIEERHVCEFCGKKFSNGGTHWQHVQDHKKTTVSSVNGVQLQRGVKGVECPVCGRCFVDLQTHLNRVHGGRTEATPDELELIKCPFCSEAIHRVRMIGHCRKEHNKSFMECRECNKMFRSASQFQEHKDKHMKVVFKCDFCEKINNTGQGKSLHMKSHHPEEYRLRVAWRVKEKKKIIASGD